MLLARVGAPVALAAMLVWALPAAAREAPVAKVSPRTGGTGTTFTVRWVTEVSSDNAGEQFFVFGPRHSRCHGLVAYTPVGFATGTQTVHMGPHANGKAGARTFSVRPEDPDPESNRDFSHWCRGVYRGRVDYENEDGQAEYTVVRFRFRVR
jgi:hypothetical protein